VADDDLVTDGALAKRAAMLAHAAQNLYDIAIMRPHLKASEALMEAIGRFDTAGSLIIKNSHDDPDQVKYRSRIRRESFPTVSGVWFFPFDPKPEEVRHEDIVAGLVNECRYNGQVPRFLSVAEHSIKVAAMAEHLIMLDVRAGRVAEEYAFHAALHALLHDAHEAYLGDIITPMKRCMMHVSGESWEVIEGRVQAAIFDAYAIPPPPPEVEEVVKLADQYALYCEAIVLKPNCDLDRWGLRVPPHDVAAVGNVRRDEPDRDKVRALFDSEVRRLIATVGGRIPDDATTTPTVNALNESIYRATREPSTPTSTGSWRSKVHKAQMDIPSTLRDAPEFKESHDGGK
jgi:hypothetical protein